MNPEFRPPGNQSSRVRHVIRTYIELSYRHPVAILLLSLILAGLGIWCASHIRLDANLQSLLPRNTETVRAMKAVDARYGNSDLFTIAIVMKDPETVARIQDSIQARLQKDWPDVVFAQTARDNAFFKQHALLYLPADYLKDIEAKLSQLRLNLGTETPLGADLLDDTDTASAMKPMAWFNASIPQQLGLPDEAADAFAEYFKAKNPEAAAEFDFKAGIPDSLRSRLIGMTRDGRTVGLVQAALKYPSYNIDYVKTVLARTQVLLDPFRKRYGSALNIGVEGPYEGLEEVNSLARNGLIATFISVGLNLLILLLYFRSLGAVVVIGWQAVFSCILTLAATALTYGRMNLYTVFVIAILFGMGTDFSIYVVGYSQKLVRAGRSWIEALEETWDVLFFSLTVHAITTIAGLLTLRVSKFVGFYEFGVIASIGVAASIAAAFFTMPACIFLWERAYRRWPRLWPSLGHNVLNLRIPSFLWRQDGRNFVRFAAAAIGVGAVVLACFIPRLRFEYDFDRLRDTQDVVDHGRPIDVALNSRRSSSQPVVVLAKDSAAMVALHDTLLHRLTVEKDPYLRSFLTLTTFVPPSEAQQERMRYIDNIGALARTRVFDRAHGDDSVMIHRLRDLSQTHPFSARDIPDWAFNLLRERDGSYGKIGFIYGNYNTSNAIEAGRFQDRYGHFDINGEHLSAYSSTFLFSDIMRLVKADSKKIFASMLLILVFFLACILRDWRLLLICSIELIVGVIWIMGLMGLLGIKVGAYNLIVISDLQGYSVNLCTYILLAYMRLGRHRMRELYSNIGVLVGVCTLTTTAGYAGMLFTSHLGIISIGNFAVLGLPTLLITALGLTPWLCTKFIPETKIRPLGPADPPLAGWDSLSLSTQSAASNLADRDPQQKF